MINHGWNFDWNDPYVFLSSDKYCKDLPSASYCGFKYPGNGMLSYTFPYGGRATLEYGQSWDSGSVHVKKNEVEILDIIKYFHARKFVDFDKPEVQMALVKVAQRISNPNIVEKIITDELENNSETLPLIGFTVLLKVAEQNQYLFL